MAQQRARRRLADAEAEGSDSDRIKPDMDGTSSGGGSGSDSGPPASVTLPTSHVGVDIEVRLFLCNTCIHNASARTHTLPCPIHEVDTECLVSLVNVFLGRLGFTLDFV